MVQGGDSLSPRRFCAFAEILRIFTTAVYVCLSQKEGKMKTLVKPRVLSAEEFSALQKSLQQNHLSPDAKSRYATAAKDLPRMQVTEYIPRNLRGQAKSH